MSTMALRRAMARPRRRLAVALVLVAVATAVAVHHAPQTGMAPMPGHSVCLAILALGAGLAAATRLARVAVLALPRPLLRIPVPTLVVLAPRSVPARAGPLYLRLCVLRR